MTSGGNGDGLIHRQVFFSYPVNDMIKQSDILRHMAAQKLTQYARGICVSDWVGHHLTRP